MLTEQAINVVYEAHKTAAGRFFDAKEDVAVAEVQLRRAESPLYETGEIKGKNPEEREASSRAALPEYWDGLDAIRKEVKSAEREYEITKIDVARVETLSRIVLADALVRSVVGK